MYSTEKEKDSTISVWFNCSLGMISLMRLTQEEARKLAEGLLGCLDDIPEVFNYE